MQNSASNVHTSRRAGAAAAAAAAEITPINSKKPLRKKTPVATKASKSSDAGPSRPAATTQLTAVRGVPDFAAAAPNTLPNFHALPSGGDGGGGGGSGGDGDGASTNGRESRPPAAPPTNSERDANGHLPLLQPQPGIDTDEMYGSQEKALSQYLKLHPVLSLESTSCQTLQLVADLVETTSIPTKELEVVPKSHDDQFLRPPNTAIGERGCCLGNRCMCVWMARWRYGEASDMAFIGTEFLLPSALATFRKSGTLPATNGKCIVCSRYFHTFIYKCARADPTFKPDARIPLQAYGNALGMACGDDVPTHSSVANDSDGYRPEAMLFVDETWTDTVAARGSMATMLWRPVVRFDTTHYEYVKDPNGTPRIVQRNVGAALDTSESHFCQPATGR